METSHLQAIILAAGKSTAFNTNRTKLLEKICGQELILYPTRLLASMHIPTTVVVGYERERVQEALTAHHNQDISFVVQEEQHGTGHAILCARNAWNSEHILIMNGDMPLVTENIIQRLYAKHIDSNATISFVTAHNADPSLDGYGRVVQQDNQIRIMEAHELPRDTHEHCCIDAGIYIVKRSFLEESIDEIEKNEVSKEFYFTDIIKIASAKDNLIATISAPFDCIRGINTFQELWVAEQIKRAELIKHWMDRGVRFSVAQNVHIDLNVTIGAGSLIGSGVHLLGSTNIGSNCNVHEFSLLDNVTLGDTSTVYSHCIIKDSVLGMQVKVGPFAHVHADNSIGNESVIGNFVEIKRSRIGSRVKAKHLAYLGDATLGNNVNIGAGTITCNHDGFKKHATKIGDNAYIGSNTTLIAPITVEQHAFTAAGSTITHDVPAYALALGRARQVNKDGYVHALREKKHIKKEPTEQTSTSSSEDKDPSCSFVGATKTSSDTYSI